MAALTPGTVCASAWQSSWVSIPFQSCHLCGSSGLFYSLSHQAHEREAAAGTGCIHLCLLPSTGCCHLCLHPAVFGTAPVAGQAAGIASSLLQSRFPLQSVTPQREGFFPRQTPFMPHSFHFSPMWQNELNSLPGTPGWSFSPVVPALS